MESARGGDENPISRAGFSMRHSTAHHEKRVHTRVELGVDVIVEPEGGVPFVCFARDVSLGGMFIESDAGLPFGVVVTVVLDLPQFTRPLRLPAVVRWTNPTGFGLQFGLLGARDTHAITSLGSRRT
jgi:type IV pilus assembly protein PilZ